MLPSRACGSRGRLPGKTYLVIVATGTLLSVCQSAGAQSLPAGHYAPLTDRKRATLEQNKNSDGRSAAVQARNLRILIPAATSRRFARIGL